MFDINRCAEGDSIYSEAVAKGFNGNYQNNFMSDTSE